MGLNKKLVENCNKTPNKPAIYSKSGNFVTYHDVFEIYQLFKSALDSYSVKSYERISVFTSDEVMAAAFGVTVLDNAVMVPIDYEASVENYSYFLELLDVDYIVSDELDNNVISVAQELGIGIIQVLVADESSSVKFKLVAEKTKKINHGKETKSHFVEIRTTSGTTSIPKIVPRTASGYMADVNVLVKHFDYSADDIILTLARIFKGYTTGLVFRMLYLGGSIVLAGDISHRDFYKILNQYDITVLITVPAVLSSFARYTQLNEHKSLKTSLRFISVAGAPMAENLKTYIEKLLNCEVSLLYGMTECSCISTTYKAHLGYKEASVGTAYNLDVKLIDDEILVKGGTVFEGYDNDGIDNDEFFTEGWFHTGDTGYIDNDGYVYVTGRIKEMINRGGEKVSPYEVEGAILSLGFIKDAAVFPYPGLDKTENVGAVIVMSEERNTDIRDIRKLLEGKLPTFKLPKILYIVDEIPSSESQKVQRKLLYNQLKDNHQAQDLDRIPENSLTFLKTERTVSRIWKKILKVKNIDFTNTFTELGGDSMDGAVALAEMEAKLNIRVPVNILFDNGSVKSVSQFIDKETKKGRRSKFLVPVKASGTSPPLFCMHSGIGDAVTYRHIGKYMNEDRPVYALRFDKRSSWPSPLEFKNLSKEYIKEIKRFQPDGPYHLCGHCWGGVLAFKIASDMKKSGDEVGIVAMLDSTSKEASVSTRIRLEGTAFQLSFMKNIVRSLKEMKQISFKGKLVFLFRKVKNIGNFFRLKYAKKLYKHGINRSNKLLIKLSGKTGMLDYAYELYNPEFYDGTVTYVKSNVKYGVSKVFSDYWKEHSDKLTIIDMDCTHNDIVVGEHAKILVKKLDDIMRIIDA